MVGRGVKRKRDNTNPDRRFASKLLYGYLNGVMVPDQKESVDYALEARRFFRIQARRYLASRPQRRFSGQCEKDAVIAMIRDAWVELRSSGRLEGLSFEGRVAVYCTTIIVFPGFVADSGEKCLVVDFRKKSKIGRCRPTVDD